MNRRRVGVLFSILLLAASLLNLSSFAPAMALTPGELAQVKFVFNEASNSYTPQGPANIVNQLSSSFTLANNASNSSTLYAFYVGNKSTGGTASGGCKLDVIRVDRASPTNPSVTYSRVNPTGNGDNWVPSGANVNNLQTAMNLVNPCSFDTAYRGSGAGVTTGGLGTPVTTPGGGSGTGNGEQPDACESHNWVGDWILCPIINVMANFVGAFYSFIVNRMEFSLFQPVAANQNGLSGLSQENYTRVKSSWQVVTRISTSLLVVVFMVMIIGQAAGNFMDNYTIKKVLPRLVIAFILINLSWYICGFAMEATNIIAGGIRGLLLLPFGGANSAGGIIVTPNLTQSGILVGGGLLGIITTFLGFLFAGGGIFATIGIFNL